MDLQLRVEDKYIIIYLTGPLDAKSVREVEEDLERVVSLHSDKDIIFNLTEVRYMSSSGLRIFISIKNSLFETGKQLKICHLADSVRKVFEMTKVTELFDIFSDEAGAIAEYK